MASYKLPENIRQRTIQQQNVISSMLDFEDVADDDWSIEIDEPYEHDILMGGAL